MANLSSSTLPDTSIKDFKKDLLAKIKQLAGLTDNERAELVKLLNDTKKYGLIWEDKPEAAEELLRTKLPVLREVVERRILSESEFTELENEQNKTIISKTIGLFDEVNEIENQDSDNGLLSEVETPNHILIEGDNLHALTALTFTHEGKIDIIYFDPPYNTGNKEDFLYNDHYIDKEDAFRHSKWLSFMNKRLLIAKRLLKEDGVIFCSIGDDEIAQLMLLFSEIFTESNRLGIIARVAKTAGDKGSYFAPSKDYVIAYINRNI